MTNPVTGKPDKRTSKQSKQSKQRNRLHGLIKTDCEQTRNVCQRYHAERDEHSDLQYINASFILLQ